MPTIISSFPNSLTESSTKVILASSFWSLASISLETSTHFSWFLLPGPSPSPAATPPPPTSKTVLAGESGWAPWPCNPSSTFSNPDPPFLFKVLTPNTWFRDSDILCSPWLLGFGLHPTPLRPRTSQHLSSPQGFAFHLASHSLFIFTGSFTVNNPTHLYSLLFLLQPFTSGSSPFFL